MFAPIICAYIFQNNQHQKLSAAPLIESLSFFLLMNPADIHASSPLPSPGFDRYEFSRSKHAEDQDDIEPIPFQPVAKKRERRMDLRCSTCDNVCNNITIWKLFRFLGNWPSLKFELHGVIHYFISYIMDSSHNIM